MTSRWHQGWRERRIGFHREAVHDDLFRFGERFLSGPPHRILVPLCGKSVDMVWLAEKGHEVVGIELVPQALAEFGEEQDLEFREEQRDGLRVLRAGAITIINADVFAVGPAHVGAIDRIWDRAALVALPEDLRARYVQTLRSLAAPGALLLQNLFEYDQERMEGPPFSVPDSEFRRHYGDAEIELLQEADKIDELEQFRAKGHEHWWVRSYLVSLP